MAGLPTVAELGRVAYIETKRVYKDIAMSLANEGWRQMPNFDQKNPFSVSDASKLIKKAKVQISDLSVDAVDKQGRAKEGDWTDDVGCTYMQLVRVFFGMGSQSKGQR
eukprot:SAG11_NODE_4_length_33019_cov_28.098909_26_plen_108_part_00